MITYSVDNTQMNTKPMRLASLAIASWCVRAIVADSAVFLNGYHI
jgi:hypothetical protein